MSNGPVFTALSALVASVLFGWTALPTAVQAQDDARTVASYVQTFYDQTERYESTFYQVFYNRVYQRYDRSYGRLAVAKDGHRIRFDYARPNGKILICAEDAVSILEPGRGGEPAQLMTGQMNRAGAAGAFGFLTGEARLADTYRFRLLDPRRFRWSGHVLELQPRTPDPRFRRVLLYVDDAEQRRGVVHKVRVYDHEGNINHFTLRRPRFNPSFAPGRFNLELPARVRRVDL